MDDDEKERKRKLLEAKMGLLGVKTLRTDYASEEHEKAELAEEARQTQASHSPSYCSDCGGSGKCSWCDGKGAEECPTCHGSGRVGGGYTKVTQGSEHTYVYQAGGFGGTCPDCMGRGVKLTGISLTPEKCSVCSGKGTCPKCGGSGRS
jgi:hypothetical protein